MGAKWQCLLKIQGRSAFEGKIHAQLDCHKQKDKRTNKLCAKAATICFRRLVKQVKICSTAGKGHFSCRFSLPLLRKSLPLLPLKPPEPSGSRRASVTCSLPRWAFLMPTRGTPPKRGEHKGGCQYPHLYFALRGRDSGGFSERGMAAVSLSKTLKPLES